MRFPLVMAGILALLGLPGCHSFGPDELKGTHPLYNQAINDSINEQYLQNLVRIHYHDPTFFLDVTNVAATLKLEMNSELGGADIGLDDASGTLGAGAAYTTQPTISYAPLQGEAFVKSLLSRIGLDKIFELNNSGWSSKRVFGLCVERINDLENSPTASGPTPELAPARNEGFMELLDLLESVREAHLIMPRYDPETKRVMVEIRSLPGYEDRIGRIKELMGVDPYRDVYLVSDNAMQRGPDVISVTTRSLMSIFFYLSHNIEAPAEHLEKGLIKETQRREGGVFDWSETPGGRLFKVYKSDSKPDNAMLAIPYRDYWFYIADNDIESKSTFMLLTQLFRLQAGSAKMAAPTLTIPVR